MMPAEKKDGTEFMGEIELASKQTRQPTPASLHQSLIISEENSGGGEEVFVGVTQRLANKQHFKIRRNSKQVHACIG